MNSNITGSVRIAAMVALFGLCLMVFFLATGAVSPEPSDHPAWQESVTRTLPGLVLLVAITFLCLPAFMFAEAVAPSWDILFCLIIACLVQTVLYFGVALGIAELVRWLRSR